jgi:DNA polymerase III subunit delta'
MQFKSIIGQQATKNRLFSSLRENRVAHTQLFLGPEGSGSFALALAFVQYINCKNKTENDSCGVCPSCIKFEKYAHPDLHFFFPTTTKEKVKKDPKSLLFINEWRSYLESVDAYPTQNGWYEYLNVGNKQGTIYVRDASDIVQTVSVKPYEARYKTLFIWMAERLHESASNKLLKTFEEPPENTLIFIFAERYELLLPTVRSRAQLVKIDKLPDEAIIETLIDRKNAEANLAHDIALIAGGNWNLAEEIYDNADETQEIFLRFRQWLRLCFRPGNFIELNKFNGDVARTGRESVKRFLAYGLEIIHNSILHNNGQSNKVKKAGDELEFSEKFAPYINSNNQTGIYTLLNEAIYHIERNAHAGILLSDLSFKIGDLLKKGSAKI